MTRKALAVALVAAVAATLGACTAVPGPVPTTPPPTSASGSASATASTAASQAPLPGSAVPSAVPSAPTEPPTFAPSEPPPAPTGPAPSTAGGLQEGDVARPEGWSPTARPGSLEEGYLGNGTWVHAVSAEYSAFAAISLGCTDLRAYPLPVAALEGTLSGPDGQAGIGVTLEFGSPAEAEAYFEEWVRQAEACLGSGTKLITRQPDLWLGRRNLDTVWSEAVGLRGEQVVLLIVDDPAADLSGAVPTR